MKHFAPNPFGRARLAAVAVLLSACAGKNGAVPPANSLRWVATPSAIAALSSDAASSGMPAEICFGGSAGRSALWLKFPGEWRSHGIPLKAYLTLSPREGATNDDSLPALSVWRASEEWRPEQLHSWADNPGLSLPNGVGPVAFAPGPEVRLDVTALMQFAAEHPERDFGLAVFSRSGSGHGAHFATGMRGGRAPRLELYFR